MRSFIENQQFFYVNDKVDFSGLKSEIGSMALEFVQNTLERVKAQTVPSIDFMNESLDEIEKEMDRWYQAYLVKISNIENTSQFLMMQNISSDENGFYSLAEIDPSLSENVSYSKGDKGFVLSSYDETFVGKK